MFLSLFAEVADVVPLFDLQEIGGGEGIFFRPRFEVDSNDFASVGEVLNLCIKLNWEIDEI